MTNHCLVNKCIYLCEKRLFVPTFLIFLLDQNGLIYNIPSGNAEKKYMLSLFDQNAVFLIVYLLLISNIQLFL